MFIEWFRRTRKWVTQVLRLALWKINYLVFVPLIDTSSSIKLKLSSLIFGIILQLQEGSPTSLYDRAITKILDLCPERKNEYNTFSLRLLSWLQPHYFFHSIVSTPRKCCIHVELKNLHMLFQNQPSKHLFNSHAIQTWEAESI